MAQSNKANAAIVRDIWPMWGNIESVLDFYRAIGTSCSQSSTALMNRRPLQHVLRRQAASLSTSATSNAWDMEQIRASLMTRRLPLTYDYLHPQPSHLLNLTLADVHPKVPLGYRDTTLPSSQRLRRLPAGHHLVYFPPQLPLSQLLPDGTDTLHSPGEPFTRRLWAGGRTRFSRSAGLWLKGDRAVCLETIRDVIGKIGGRGPPRILVKIERRIGVVQEDEPEEHVRSRLFREDSEEFGGASIIEDRDIVFLPGKSQAEINRDKRNFWTRFIKRVFSFPPVYLRNPMLTVSRLSLPLPLKRLPSLNSPM